MLDASLYLLRSYSCVTLNIYRVWIFIVGSSYNYFAFGASSRQQNVFQQPDQVVFCVCSPIDTKYELQSWGISVSTLTSTRIHTHHRSVWQTRTYCTTCRSENYIQMKCTYCQWELPRTAVHHICYHCYLDPTVPAAALAPAHSAYHPSSILKKPTFIQNREHRGSVNNLMKNWQYQTSSSQYNRAITPHTWLHIFCVTTVKWWYHFTRYERKPFHEYD